MSYDVLLCKELPLGVMMIAPAQKIFSGINF